MMTVIMFCTCGNLLWPHREPSGDIVLTCKICGYTLPLEEALHCNITRAAPRATLETELQTHNTTKSPSKTVITPEQCKTEKDHRYVTIAELRNFRGTIKSVLKICIKCGKTIRETID